MTSNGKAIAMTEFEPLPRNPHVVIGLLRCLAVVHQSLEGERLFGWAAPAPTLGQCLQRDLENARMSPWGHSVAAYEAVLALVADLRTASERFRRESLRRTDDAGAAFAAGIRNDLESIRRLLLTAGALSVCTECGVGTTFLTAPAPADDAPELPTGVAPAFRECIACLVSDEPGPPVALSINPEAGWQLSPVSAQELAAVDAAWQVTYELFPYLEARYGERGRRFAASDGLWLTTILDLPPSLRQSSIDWLRGVLAKRGLPSVILWAFLDSLGTTLAYAGQRVPAGLREERSALFDEYLRILARRPGQPDLGELDPVERLCVAVVADEGHGIENCRQAFANWFEGEEHVRVVRILSEFSGGDRSA